MGGTECRNRGILAIEKALEEFDKVILIDNKLHDWRMTGAFYDEDNFKETDKKVLILSEAEEKRVGNIEWQSISEREAREILEIYYLYEFSNRIAVVDREQAFGSLWDYVATGLLTEEELVEAILK
ncbi:MAG TPA: hypothetical protein DCZ91_16310 [Lachnospiraceae bacterium]|nr:hypothetical protein [Lachnospiraceae bacterium]